MLLCCAGPHPSAGLFSSTWQTARSAVACAPYAALGWKDKKASRLIARGILDSYRASQGNAPSTVDSAPKEDSSVRGPAVSADEDECRADCVTEVFDKSEFDGELRSVSPSTLVVVDFYRTACGSCKYIQPGFAKLCKNSGEHHAAVLFLKHNIIDEYDEETDLAQHLKIKAVPQFDFYLGGKLVERFATRDKARIAEAINKHAGEGTVVLSEINRTPGQPRAS